MLKAWIHSIERAHWARENRRVTYPFEWGIEHLGGDPARDDEDTVAIREFNSALSDDPRITLSLLPIADGLTLARKR